MVTTPWLAYLPKICAGRTFDQVWLNDLSHFADLNLDFSSIVDMAPVRLGLVTESVEYHPQDYKIFPWLRERRARIERQFQNITHIAAVDEQDVIDLKEKLDMPTMWLPCSIPERLIASKALAPSQDLAFFSGSIYGERTQWLENPKLKNLLAPHRPSRVERFYPFFFNILFGHNLLPLSNVSSLPIHRLYPIYLKLLRYIRYSSFLTWQQNILQKGTAVVNLPHLVKGYSSRVIEGMAAGRPVISWEIPNRPWNKAMFESGKEILLYSTPDELARHIKHVLSDAQFVRRVVTDAQQKVKKWHTTEKRMEQVLHWLECGEEPNYDVL